MDQDVGTHDMYIRGGETSGDREYLWFALLLLIVLAGSAGH